MSNLLKGYTCKCGKFIRFVGFVYAHWQAKLRHTCECGITVYVEQGVAMTVDGEILSRG